MLNTKLLAVLSLIMLFGAIHSSKDKRRERKHVKRACLDEPPKWDFNPAKFPGRFYVTAFDDPSRRSIQCQLYLILDSKEEGIYPVIELYREKSDSSTHMVFRDLMLNSTGCGINSKNQPFTVAHIDYDNYAIIFTCDQSTNEGFVSLLTRKPNPPFTDIYEAEFLLHHIERDLNTLTFMNQSKCPEDWSEAQMEETDFTYDEVRADLIANGITKE